MGDEDHSADHDSHDDHGHSHELHAHDDHSHDGDDHSHDGDDHSHENHDHHHHHDVETLGAAVVTISTSRSLDDDPAGDAIAETFEEAGHEISTRDLIADDYDGVQSALGSVAKRKDVDVVVTTGGTGVTPDDVTVEAVERLFTKRLPGFGELFRRESYDEVGVMVVATRATAGIIAGTPVFCLPGSENAAQLGADIAVDAAGHLAGLARRDDDEADEEDALGHGHDHTHD